MGGNGRRAVPEWSVNREAWLLAVGDARHARPEKGREVCKNQKYGFYNSKFKMKMFHPSLVKRQRLLALAPKIYLHMLKTRLIAFSFRFLVVKFS